MPADARTVGSATICVVSAPTGSPVIAPNRPHDWFHGDQVFRPEAALCSAWALRTRREQRRRRRTDENRIGERRNTFAYRDLTTVLQLSEVRPLRTISSTSSIREDAGQS
jgi:hypothetical protein